MKSFRPGVAVLSEPAGQLAFHRLQAGRRGKGTMRRIRVRPLVVIVALVASSLPGVAPIVGASAEAEFAAAGHRVLVRYLPAPWCLAADRSDAAGRCGHR
jgi:hypothetical protein